MADVRINGISAEDVRESARQGGRIVGGGAEAAQGSQVQYGGGGDNQFVDNRQGGVQYSENAVPSETSSTSFEGGGLESLSVSDVSSMAAVEPRQETRSMVMPTPSVRQQETPQRQAVASGMQEARQQQAPQQQARPVQESGTPMAKEAPAGGDGLVKAVDLPSNEMPMLSSRQRLQTFDEAVESGNPVARRAEELAFARESSQLDKPKPGSRAYDNLHRQREQRRIGNAAERAVARDMAKMANAPSDRQRPFWVEPIKRVTRFTQNFLMRPDATEEKERKRAARSFKNEGVGNHIYGKMLGYGKLDFRDVGIGLQEIAAVKSQNPGMLERLLAPYVMDDMSSVAAMPLSDVVRIINDNEVFVATFKSPNNQGQDMQRRRLKVLTDQQRGIFLHNIMAAMYTADYDGDDMAISLDPTVTNKTKDPMDYMVDIFGKMSLNMDFIPVSIIVPVDGKSERDYVKEIMLANFLSNEDGASIDERTLSPLVDSILKIGESARPGSKIEPEQAYGDMILAARRFADRTRGFFSKDSSAIMSDVCRAVFDCMQRTKYYNTLTTIGSDTLVLSDGYVPRPKTMDDVRLYEVVDGMVEGKMPNNFQELKLLLTGFTGNVEGKNAPFRFTADVGKMMKMDERLIVGNNYVVDPNDDEQMKLFFQTTVKYAGARKMAKEIKNRGRSEYYTQVLRESVIREVGFPSSYTSFEEFLNKFARSYNKNSTLMNEANLVFLTNMGISEKESKHVVSSIRSSENGLTLSDLAEPMISVYGTYSVGRVFDKLVSSGRMKVGNYDPEWKGNPENRRRGKGSTTEAEYGKRNQDTFWITGKYIDYSLRQFRDENRMVRGNDREQNEIRQKRVKGVSDQLHGDVGAQLDMLLAIADKRTGAASKYNKTRFGNTDNTYLSDNDRTVVNMMSTLLTSVSYAMREGNQTISPGYYAGVGQRKNLPDGVFDAMKDVSKRLRNMGWVLRSGGAEGSDTAFQIGAGKDSIVYTSTKQEKEKLKHAYGFVMGLDEMTDAQVSEARASVMRLHPKHGKGLDEYATGKMARNYWQVVGTDGTMDSAFVACYADQNSRGTWQTIRLAKERGIPVFNAAEYEDIEQWKADVIHAATMAGAGQLTTTSNDGNDRSLEIEEAIRALIAANPDLFLHFNMDSPATFLESAYGKMMLKHATEPQIIGGIYLSMVFDYKMDRITSLTDELLSLDDTTRLEETWNDIMFAKDELASSSGVWRGIIKEFEMEATEGEKSFFQMMRENDVKMEASDGYTYAWDINKDGVAFWSNPGRHRTLRSLIDDLDVDIDTKRNVIADVVRYWNKDAYLKSYEVGYQMEVGKNAAYVLGDAPEQGMSRVYNDFEDAFNRWGKRSQAMLREDIEKAHLVWQRKPGALTEAIRRLDKEPWELVDIDDGMYADSILSVYDKTYKQTEKASQNPWTNSVYAALSFQQVGGYQNDITKTDDRLLGLTYADSVTVQDIIHLLANPQEELTVYNKDGSYGFLSCDILLQAELKGGYTGDRETDMWQFLLREPRIAACIRRHSACVGEDAKGNGFMGARNSINETISLMNDSHTDHIRHVKYLMRDHPGYAAIVALALPGKNLVTRNARNRIKKIEDFFAYDLYMAASQSDDSTDLAPIVLKDMGIDDAVLKEAMRSDYDTYLMNIGLVAYEGGEPLESDGDALEIYEQASRWVADYIDEIRNGGVLLRQEIEEPDIEDDIQVGPDAVSAAAFWDVVQELSGAKTSVSTGIEGSETYNYAEWASHIQARDRYADLKALGEEELDDSWDGLWTNFRNHDGTPVMLETKQVDVIGEYEVRKGVSITMTTLDDDGNVVSNKYWLRPSSSDLSFDDAAEEMKKIDPSFNDVIVQVPEGYTVKDRSTDSHGTQVASFYAYMVSKRSNGAEAFNLKAKKAGIDGKDSVTKKLFGGMHSGDSFLGILGNLRIIADYNGMYATKLKLAQMMKAMNEEIGYKDMTLANYMSMTDLMLFTGDDGMLYLRSLEMLMTAIKYRIGSRVDDMSDEQLTEAVKAIVEDVGETAVGRTMSNSVDSLDSLKPKSRAMQYNAIRQHSSVFANNYPLLKEIADQAEAEGMVPLGPKKTEKLDERNRYLIDGTFGEKREADEFRSLTRGYHIIGTYGCGKDVDQDNWSVGPSNVLYIGSYVDDETMDDMCRTAEWLGMTIICKMSSVDSLPDHMKKDAVPLGDMHVLVPCFDARLNGSEANPYKARFAIAQVDPSKYVVSVEDSTNEFGLGDAEAQALRHLTDNMKIVQSDTTKILAEDLFPNVFKNPDFRDCHFSVGLASGQEIRNLIAEDVRCTIDYGVVEDAKGFEQRVHDVDWAIERYRRNYQLANPDGLMMMEECEPGDIVGWAQIEIRHRDGKREYAFAPIIPFPLHGVKRQPSKFSVGNMGPVGDHSIFEVDWTNTTDLNNEFVKYFDSSGGANKGMISLSQALDEDRTLMDGTPIDIYIAKASTDSRKVGTDRRIKTMITLMAMARLHGYNFARNEDGSMNEAAFPDRPDLRERLFRERIPRDEWTTILKDGTRFTVDDTLDAFIRYECAKVAFDGGNPSDYLANIYTDEEGNESKTNVMWEFEAMFDQGLNYEDGLLKFLSFVNPLSANEYGMERFCPNGIDDTSSNCLFRLYQEDGAIAEGYDRGVLQLRVPHRLSSGRTAYMWDNVYVGLSFFGEEYSGFSRPNVDGASVFLDGMNTMSMYGKRMGKSGARQRARWATSDIARYPHGNGSIERA